MGISASQAIRGYSLSKTIGVGPFSTVHKGVQPGLKREVAIKIILPELANQQEFVLRFETQCQRVVRLTHPNIVPLYDYWREPDGAFLIMPCFSGNLESLVANGPLALEQVASLVDQLSGALELAHHNGVMHLNLKPQNVLLDNNQQVFLTDFGNLDYLELGVGNSIVAANSYLAPEQLNGLVPSVQADVYGLGCVLYHALTGLSPVPAGERVAGSDPAFPSLHETVPGLPEALDEVLQKATAIAPEDRYADIISFADAFHNALNGEIAHASDTQTADTLVLPDVDAPSESADHVASTALDRFVKGSRGIRWRFERKTANPYKGLKPFEMPDADDFFGRESLTESLIARLAEAGDFARFLAVVGPSGSGKSSVVKAGVLMGLRHGALPGSDRWLIAEMTPHSQPLEELRTALLSVAAHKAPDIVSQLKNDANGLTHVIEALFPGDEELVLVIDQFEELFTLVQDQDVARHFLDLIYAAVTNQQSRVRVIITLRADFYDRPLMFPDFSDLVANRTEAVSTLSPAELERAIVAPGERVGISWAPKLVSLVIAEVKDQPGTLPLLQYALTELFERRDGNTITESAYEDLGGILGALTKRADEVYAELDETQQAVTRQLFLRLTTLGEGTEDTRRQALQSELLSLGGETMQAVIDIFGQSRLLTFDHESLTREPTVEVAHEAIIREWKQLRTWLDESRDDLRLQRRLALSAQEWRTSGKDPSFLAAGTRLAQLESWYETTALALSEIEQDYVRASIAERDRQLALEADRQAREAALEARARRNLQIVTIVSAVAGVVAVILTIFALAQTQIAREANLQSQHAADVSSEIAILTNAQLSLYRYDNTDLAIALALEGQQMGNLPDRETRVMTETMYAPGTRRVFTGATDQTYRFDLNSDATQVVSGGHDTIIRLWDVETGALLRQFEGHEDEVMEVVFGPDDQTIVSASRDETVRFWDVETGEVLQTLEGAEDFMALDFAPDGKTLATGAVDQTVRIWDVETGELLVTFEPDDPETEELEGHATWLRDVTFSPDGQSIVSADESGYVLRWSVEDEALAQVISEGELEHVYDSVFSPDGTTLVTGAFVNHVAVWDVETGELRLTLRGHTASVLGVDFSPDGKTVITASQDKTLRLWDVETGAEIHRFVGHSDRVYDVAFLPDGDQFVSSSYDSTLRLWDIETDQMLRRLAGHEQTIYQVTFNADGTLLASGSRDQTVRLWDVATGEELRVFGPDDPDTEAIEGHDDRVISVAFSPDGRHILSGALDSYLLLWDAETGELLQVMEPDDPETEIVEGHEKTPEGSTDSKFVWYVTFSADGRYAYSSAFDKTIIKWDLETGEVVRQYTGHTEGVLGVTLLSDGKHFLTHSWDKTIILWDDATGEIIRRYEGHDNWIWSVALSPDEKTFVSASADNTLILWDLEAGQPIRYFLGHEDAVLSVDFSVDGQYIVSSGRDKRVSLWNIETAEWLRDYGGHTNWVRSVDYSPVEDIFVTGDNDGAIFLWERRSLDEMVEWANQNRYVRELTCEEREFYQVEPYCTDDAALAEPES